MMTDININRPPHLVANAIIREIEAYLWDGGKGIGVKFGHEGHAMIENIVNQYNREIWRQEDKANELDDEKLKLLDQIAALEVQHKHHQTALQEIIDYDTGLREGGWEDILNIQKIAQTSLAAQEK